MLVGVKKYRHDSLPDLPHTESDAEGLAAVLKGKAAGFDDVVVLVALAGHGLQLTIGGGAKQTPHEIKNLIGKAPVLAVAAAQPGGRPAEQGKAEMTELEKALARRDPPAAVGNAR